MLVFRKAQLRPRKTRLMSSRARKHRVWWQGAAAVRHEVWQAAFCFCGADCELDTWEAFVSGIVYATLRRL